MPNILPLEEELFDIFIAADRIKHQNGGLNNIRNIFDLHLSEHDFSSAQELYDKERSIIYNASNTLTDEGLFRGAMYCILSVQEEYPTLMYMFNNLERSGMLELGSVEHNELADLLKPGNLNNQKHDRIMRLQHEWYAHDIKDRVSFALEDGHEAQVDLMKYFDRNVIGFGPKVYAMFMRMCGGDHNIVTDSVLLKTWYYKGFPDIEIRRRIRDRTHDNKSKSLGKSDITRVQRERSEELTIEFSQKHDVTPAIYQLAYFTKLGTYHQPLRENLREKNQSSDL